MTFEELYALEEGTIVDQWEQDGIQCLILRGPAALCAYLGIPKDHPLAGFHYDNEVWNEIRVHGGLTYSDFGRDDYSRDANFYWIGWDYGHYQDAAFYDIKYQYQTHGNMKWTDAEVKPEVMEACKQLSAILHAQAFKSVIEALQSPGESS